MKLLEYKQFNNSDENQEKSLNKKKVIMASSAAVAVLIIIILIILYSVNPSFRNFMDAHVLFKHLDEKNLAYINIESDENFYTYAYYNYVVALQNNNLTLYNSSGKEVASFNVKVSSPIFAAQDNYLVVAEKNQQKVYVFKDKRLLWQKDVDGQVSRIDVNENGYVCVVVSGTSYKSVITTYSEEGKEVFKTFLSNTVVVDADISSDNNYLSFCEMDLSGAIIESKVKTISIEKAKQDPANAIIYTYGIPTNSLVTNIEYHEKNELICLCDNKICKLKDGNIETIAELDDSSVTFCGINLSKSFFQLKENKFGINNQKSDIEIYNTSNKKLSSYTIDGIAKDVYAKDGVIAVNLGNEVYFINEKGWLIKKVTTSQEINGIVISNNIAGIIFRNKIAFLSL